MRCNVPACRLTLARTRQFYDNQVVVWDKILTAKEDGNITLTNKKIKYSLRDHGHGARAR